MRNNSTPLFVLASVIFMLTFMIIVNSQSYISTTGITQAETKQLVTECEKALPRNEKCELVAVPQSSLK